MKEELMLTSLISSRICHDLISPIGAINNGLELLAMTDGDKEEEVSLIATSAQSAADSLRFLRIAFGASSATEMMRTAEIANIAQSHLATQRLSVEWEVADEEISRAAAKLVLLMAQTGAAGAPLGGVMLIRSSQTKFPYTISLDGPKIGLDPAASRALSGGATLAEIEPRHAPLVLFSLLAKEAGYEIDWMTDGAQGRLQLV